MRPHALSLASSYLDMRSNTHKVIPIFTHLHLLQLNIQILCHQLIPEQNNSRALHIKFCETSGISPLQCLGAFMKANLQTTGPAASTEDGYRGDNWPLMPNGTEWDGFALTWLHNQVEFEAAVYHLLEKLLRSQLLVCSIPATPSDLKSPDSGCQRTSVGDKSCFLTCPRVTLPLGRKLARARRSV